LLAQFYYPTRQYKTKKISLNNRINDYRKITLKSVNKDLIKNKMRRIQEYLQDAKNILNLGEEKIAEGEGVSKQEAEQNAAMEGLKAKNWA